MKIHFYLRPPDKNYRNRKDGEPDSKSLIILQIKHRGLTLRWSTGESIHPENWDYKDERVRNVTATRKSREIAINKHLDDYKGEAADFVLADVKRYPTQPEFRGHMKKYAKSKHPDYVEPTIQDEPELVAPAGPTFHSMIQEVVDRAKRRGAKGTIDNAIAMQKHFLALAPPPFNFDDLTEGWFDDFDEALRNGDHSEDGRTCGGGTINNDLQVIRKIMETANTLGLTKNRAYETFEVDVEGADGVALTPEEIETIYNLDIKEKRLSEARDLLIVALHTGLRWSDFHNIAPDRIIKNNGGFDFVIQTKKTGAPVTVPAHPAILQIFKRYPDSPNMLPQGHRKRQFNDDVKAICENAKGFDLAGLSWKNPSKALWKMMSSRIGRRSFATNLYNDREANKMSLMEIMQLTGHRTETAFFKYIKPRTTASTDALRRIHETNKHKY